MYIRPLYIESLQYCLKNKTEQREYKNQEQTLFPLILNILLGFFVVAISTIGKYKGRAIRVNISND